MKKLTCTNNKERYGAHHVAEPDHRVLGEKLKGQFKQVYMRHSKTNPWVNIYRIISEFRIVRGTFHRNMES